MVVNHVVLYWAGWLWFMECYNEPVVVNNGELFWTSGCQSWCIVLGQWLCIIVWYAQQVVVNHGVLYWDGWLWIIVWYAELSGCGSLCGMQSWVFVNHVVLCWVSGCESCCVILNKLVWFMVCYAELMVVNHCVLCWISGCVSWCIMLFQLLWITV